MCNDVIITYGSINPDGSCTCTNTAKDIVKFIIEHTIVPIPLKEEEALFIGKDNFNWVSERIPKDSEMFKKAVVHHKVSTLDAVYTWIEYHKETLQSSICPEINISHIIIVYKLNGELYLSYFE